MRSHPVATDVLIALALTAVTLAVVPGLAIVGLGLIAVALGAGAAALARRRTSGFPGVRDG